MLVVSFLYDFQTSFVEYTDMSVVIGRKIVQLPKQTVRAFEPSENNALRVLRTCTEVIRSRGCAVTLSLPFLKMHIANACFNRPTESEPDNPRILCNKQWSRRTRVSLILQHVVSLRLYAGMGYSKWKVTFSSLFKPEFFSPPFVRCYNWKMYPCFLQPLESSFYHSIITFLSRNEENIFFKLENLFNGNNEFIEKLTVNNFHTFHFSLKLIYR